MKKMGSRVLDYYYFIPSVFSSLYSNIHTHIDCISPIYIHTFFFVGEGGGRSLILSAFEKKNGRPHRKWACEWFLWHCVQACKRRLMFVFKRIYNRLFFFVSSFFYCIITNLRSRFHPHRSLSRAAGFFSTDIALCLHPISILWVR